LSIYKQSGRESHSIDLSEGWKYILKALEMLSVLIAARSAWKNALGVFGYL